MYLLLALLAPLVMFLLIPGLAWFEDRVLGPQSPPTTLPPGTPSAVVASGSPLAVPAAARVSRSAGVSGSARVSGSVSAALPGGHTIRTDRPRHARRPAPLDYRHHIAGRRPPRAPLFR
jgi:hypothetical protein